MIDGIVHQAIPLTGNTYHSTLDQLGNASTKKNAHFDFGDPLSSSYLGLQRHDQSAADSIFPYLPSLQTQIHYTSRTLPINGCKQEGA
jgi:hypothetical protein